MNLEFERRLELTMEGPCPRSPSAISNGDFSYPTRGGCLKARIGVPMELAIASNNRS